MKHRVLKSFLGVALLCWAVVLLSGCAKCKPGKPGPVGKYDIEVNLDDSLKSSSVIVDLVGVNASGLPRWEKYDMTKYWKEGDAMRHDADKEVLNFVSGQKKSQTMEMSNPRWETWKNMGVTHVFVLADLPGSHSSQPGAEDARRQMIPLDRCSWPDKTKSIKLLVKRSGIVVQTASRSF
jgi:hypothetical protein